MFSDYNEIHIYKKIFVSRVEETEYSMVISVTGKYKNTGKTVFLMTMREGS